MVYLSCVERVKCLVGKGKVRKDLAREGKGLAGKGEGLYRKGIDLARKGQGLTGKVEVLGL